MKKQGEDLKREADRLYDLLFPVLYDLSVGDNPQEDAGVPIKLVIIR